jgi:flagellar operon protein
MLMVSNPIDIPKGIIPVKPVDTQKIQQGKQEQKVQTAFSDVLKQKVQEIGNLKLSSHAAQSLEKRKIDLSEGDMLNLKDAVEKAQAKGSKDSLFLMGDLALIVSIKNKTVVTAIDKDHIKDNVFTKIDSAIIIDSDKKIQQ